MTPTRQTTEVGRRVLWEPEDEAMPGLVESDPESDNDDIRTQLIGEHHSHSSDLQCTSDLIIIHYLQCGTVSTINIVITFERRYTV